jgi:hypothetical protein
MRPTPVGRVVKYGTYGTDHDRRQMFRCYPKDGGYVWGEKL